MTEPQEKTPEPFHQTPLFRGIVIAAIVAGGVYWYRSSSENNGAASGARIDAFEKSIEQGKPDFADAPACGPDARTCLDTIAKYFGSRTTFNLDKPDQASCATVALLLLRDGNGAEFQSAKPWMELLKTGKGKGVDALRGAVAIAMANHAAEVGQKFADETTFTPLLHAVSASIPGSCDTYYALARGDKMENMEPQLSPDHSACVQNDLSRREGPGGRYGYGKGMFRAAEGAAAVWREEERALRIGLLQGSPEIQKLLNDKLAIMEPLTQKIDITKLEDSEPEIMNYIGEVHAEAGIKLWKSSKDAGADGAAPVADAGLLTAPMNSALPKKK